jgi:hypothetical protein
VSSEIAARLERLGIAWVATEKGYTMFTRDNCAAIGHEQAGGVSIGSSGVMTESGLAYLVWRDGRAFLSSHGGSQTPAGDEQLKAVRRFSEDLKAALAR